MVHSSGLEEILYTASLEDIKDIIKKIKANQELRTSERQVNSVNHEAINKDFDQKGDDYE